MDDASILLRYLPAGARRVLDCACGDGALGAALKRFGAGEVVGIEADPAKAKEAETVLDRVIPGTPERAEIPYAPGYFDAAVCDGVLARVIDHTGTLKRIAPYLAPGAKLVVQAPNLQYYENVVNLLEGRWEYGATEALDRANLRFFTAFSLVQSITAAGFECEQAMVARLVNEALVPWDAEGFIRFGRFRIGPVDEHGRNGYRAKSIIVVAARKADA